MLKIEELSYSYQDRQAVCGASFEVREGECLGLLGPNGAGKTTAISCMVGLLSAWQGAMFWHGEPFQPALQASDRGQLGFVPQEIALYANLTAEENLDLFGELNGLGKAERRKAVEKNLELAGLVDRQKDLVRTFSGGMQRRLNLAAGLMHSPSLVLLDEPTVGVDPQSRNHLFETLLQLKADGVSLLYTTHFMEEAQRLCDRIAIMNEGSVIAVGTPQELAEQSGEPESDLEKIFLKLTGRSLRDD